MFNRFFGVLTAVLFCAGVASVESSERIAEDAKFSQGLTLGWYVVSLQDTVDL